MKKFEEITSNKQNIAKICRTIRLEHHMTVEDFALFSGVSRQTINNFESGRHLNLEVFLKYYALDVRGVDNETKKINNL